MPADQPDNPSQPSPGPGIPSEELRKAMQAFKKRLKLKWRQYIPVVGAGFGCGMGLVTTMGVGITFLSKSVIKMSF